MRDLNWDLLQLQRRAGDDGSHATRWDRFYALAQMADALHEAGYRGLRAKGLKGKHIEALVRHWRHRRLSDATLMNRMAHVRWWADQVGKANLVGSKPEYGIGPRSHVSDGTKRRDLDEAKLARVNDVVAQCGDLFRPLWLIGRLMNDLSGNCCPVHYGLPERQPAVYVTRA